jgi:hypothetical protein
VSLRPSGVVGVEQQQQHGLPSFVGLPMGTSDSMDLPSPPAFCRQDTFGGNISFVFLSATDVGDVLYLYSDNCYIFVAHFSSLYISQ